MKGLQTALGLLAATLCLLAASPVVAQDDEGTMTFGEEDAEEVSDENADDGGSDDGTMTFGEEESGDSGLEEGNKEPPLVGFVAVPTEAIDDSQREKLQSKLTEVMRNIPDIKMQMGPAVMSALQERTIATCVTEPLCLGSVGEKAGVDQLVIARVKEGSRGMELEVDYFDVGDRLFIKSDDAMRLGSFKEVLDNVEPVTKSVFGIRGDRDSQEFADENTSLARTITAVGCGVLSVGALTGGIVFGNQASSIESDLNSFEKNENGVYKELTQSEAKSMLSDAQGKAATANIFYGLSGAFAIASTVLFIVDPGGDVDQSGRAGLFERIDVAPSFGRSGAGFSATIDF